MKVFQYYQPAEVDHTEDVEVYNESNQVVAIYRRKYDNGLKKKMDRFFDYRYFVKYEVDNSSGEKVFEVKKMNRRGKLWFEGKDIKVNKNYMISYENWRIGIPELYISDGDLKVTIHKEMEDWSNFLYEDQVIARWMADYNEQSFQMTLQIEDNSPIQSVEFFIGICQATLFIGA